jgi:WD40 repeat protein/serine/threonine protein kinase
MAQVAVDRSLLFGILALQVGMIEQADLLDAFHRWSQDKSCHLAQILVDRGALTAEDRATLDGLVRRHIERYGGNMERSLAAMAAPGAFLAGLRRVGDREIEASLAYVSAQSDGAPSSPDRLGLTKAGSEFDSDATTDWSLAHSTSAGGRYHILRPHARGGIGLVSVALDAELHREVALKEILPEQADNPTSRTRFLREAEITGRLEHPGIVPVYGLGMCDAGRPYYVMRFVRGETLKEAIDHSRQADALAASERAGKSRALRQLLSRFLDACNALSYAHSRGVVHRDIKPSNILLGPYGETLVVDWGLAKVVGQDVPVESAEGTLRPEGPSGGSGSSETVAGTAVGTPAYMSPEQAEGRIEAIRPASDVYSLGATLYCILTGRPPFEGGDLVEVVRQVRQGDFPAPRRLDPRVPAALDAVVRKAMALRPGDRYASVQHLAADVEHWLADEPVTAHADPLPARLARWTRRHRTATAALAILVIAGLAASTAGTVLIGREQARTERQLYINRVNLAYREALVGNIPLASQLLDDCPTTHRGWEWAYCRALLHREAVTLAGHGPNPSRRPYVNEALLSQGVAAVAFSPDGRSVASAGHDHVVRIWDALTGREVRSLAGHGDAVVDLSYGGNGAMLVSSAMDGKIILWDPAAGRASRTLDGPVSPLAIPSALSPDGRSVVSVASGTVRCWDPATGGLRWSQFKALEPASACRFTPDGQHLAVAEIAGTIRILDAGTGRELRSLGGGNQHYCLTVDPTGRTIAAGEPDGFIRVWEIETGHEVVRFRGHTDMVRDLAFSPDGRWIASAGWDRCVRLWNTASWREVSTFRGHESRVQCVRFSPDGRRLATGSSDGRVKLWDVGPGGDAYVSEGLGWRPAVAFSPDGRTLASGAYGFVTVADAGTGELRALLATRPPWDVYGLAFSPDGRRLASCSHTQSRSAGATVELWDLAAAKRLATLAGHTGLVCAAAFRPEGHMLASASDDGTVRLWDPEAFREIRVLSGHRGPVKGLAFRPDGRALASVSSDGTVRLWDPDSGLTIRTWAGVIKADNPMGNPVAFSPDGRRLAIAGDDGVVSVWDCDAARRVLALRGHWGLVYSVAFSPDGRRIASAGDDGTIKLWDPDDGAEVFSLRGHTGAVVGVAFSPDGRRIASGSIDHTMRVWELDPPSSELTCRRWIETQADRLIGSLIVREGQSADATIVARVQGDPTLEEPVRAAALRRARLGTGNAHLANARAWELVRTPGRSATEYRAAHEIAEIACRSDPESGSYLNTLGVALYRVGRYEEALETLKRSAALNAPPTGDPIPEDLAFLAMTHQRLGHSAEARKLLDRLRAIVKSGGRSQQEEIHAFLRECESTVMSPESSRY